MVARHYALGPDLKLPWGVMTRLAIALALVLSTPLVSLAEPATRVARAVDAGSGVPANDQACVGGVVNDDGTAETGYSWVPSVIEGTYVLELDSSALALREIDTVCICWLRTGADDEIDYEVVFFEDEGGLPVLEPFAAIPATASGVPDGVPGQLYEVDVSGVTVPLGTFYVGARWNPSIDGFFFVCSDNSQSGPVTEAWFIDDRAKGEWTSALKTKDPIFSDYTSLFVRAVGSGAAPIDVPTLPYAGLVVLASALGLAALADLLRRR